MREGRMHRGFRERHMEGGHRHGGRGSWRRRMFDHGELRLVMLKLIADKPRHGYEVIKEIEERLGGSYSPSPGVVYPTLTMLEELGYATVAEEDGKKRYAITESGAAHLEQNREAVESVFARMERAGVAQGPSPQVVRAMENLRLALRMRLARGPLSDGQANAVAAALDAAATAVERT